MNKEYDKYEVNDFLKDNDFLLWRISPTAESDAFWSQFIKEYPIQVKHLERAIQIIQSMDINNSRLTQEDMEDLEIIYSQTKELYNNKKTKLNPRLYYVGVAASIAVLCALSILYYISKPISRMEGGSAAIVESQTVSTNIQLQLGTSEKIVFANDADFILNSKGEIQISEKSARHIILTKTTKQGQDNQLIVPHGKRASLTLSDGTKVWINSGTNLSFPSIFAKACREISVNEGEVYMEVTKDKKKPFFVNTSFGKVKVLGTRFNITAYSEDQTKSIVLAEGGVEVILPFSGSLYLKPDQMLSISNNISHIFSVDSYNYICWKDGIMKFTNEKLENILLRLSRHYGVEFICDETSRQKACTGKMLLFDDLDEVLKTLTDIFPIQYKVKNDSVEINVKP